jgi:hypothetical protein
MDIRALVGRKNVNESWRLIFLKIMLSNKSRAEIEAEHEKINNEIPSRDNENGKLIPMYLPANDLISFIEQLDSGSITLKNERICCGENLCIQNIGFTKHRNFLTKENKLIYWVGYAVHNTLTETISKQIGLNTSKMRLRFHELNDWFDIPDNDWKNTCTKVVILIPIPIRRESIFCNDRSTLTINYSISTTLLPKLDQTIRIYYTDGEQKKIVSNVGVQYQNKASNLFTSVILTIENTKVENMRNIESTFYHSGLDDELFVDDTFNDLPVFDDTHLLSDPLDLGFDDGNHLPIRSGNSMTRPETPYSNIKLMEDTLEKCQGYIHWVDKYFSKSNLDFLTGADLTGRVNEMKLLGSTAKCDEKMKSYFKSFRKEMKNQNISCEMRIIVDRKIYSHLHDRWILSENIKFNAISGDVVKRGQFAEISVTSNTPPFMEWWKSSLDIINNFDEIMRAKEELEKQS